MSRPVSALALVALLTLFSPPARANGAFPDDLRVLLPHGKPERLVVATNFGLVISDDDGAHWDYVCETAITGRLATIRLYVQGPADTLYAIWPEGLAHSDDGGCTWIPAGGALAGLSVSDVFADPSDDQRVFALAMAPDRTFGIYVSHDRGTTFDAPILSGPTQLLSIESATTDKDVILTTSFGVESPDTAAAARLLRSTDGGASWTKTRVDALSSARARILSIDPGDASLAYLRLTSPETNTDRLGLAHEGVVAVDDGLALDGLMGGFARGADGALYVGTANGKLWTREAGSTAWTSQPGPRFRCLAERDGVLYGCGSNATDGYALAISRDRGATWEPKLNFSRIRGPRACAAVQDACSAEWETLRVTLGADQNDPADAGTDAPAAADAGTDIETPPPPARGGCGCSEADPGFSLLALGFLGAVRRRAAIGGGAAKLSLLVSAVSSRK